MAKFKVFYILYSIFNIYVENKKEAGNFLLPASS